MRQKRIYTYPDTLSCCTSRIPSILVIGYFINRFIKIRGLLSFIYILYLTSKHTLTQNKKMDRVRFKLSPCKRQRICILCFADHAAWLVIYPEEICNTMTPEYVDFFSASIY